MASIIIDLSDQQFEKVQELAQKLGVAPEEWLRTSIKNLLDYPKSEAANDELECWELCIDGEKADDIRRDAKFSALMRLARVVNALNFCSHNRIETSKDLHPARQRRYWQSFLFSFGILHEGLKVANDISKHFKDCESYKSKSGFSQLLEDGETKNLKNTLHNMRDKLVHHYDANVGGEMLEELDSSPFIFARGFGHQTGDIYYFVADEIAINCMITGAFTKKDGIKRFTKEEEAKRFKELFSSVDRVSAKFLRAADQLIIEELQKRNWYRRKSQT